MTAENTSPSDVAKQHDPNQPKPPAEFDLTSGELTLPGGHAKTNPAVPEDGLPSPSPKTPSPSNATASEGHPPARLGRIRDYELLEKLGEGGMGTVYKAMHVNLKRRVAVKILPRDRLVDPQAVARFKREMEAVGQLVHPNIVWPTAPAGAARSRHRQFRPPLASPFTPPEAATTRAASQGAPPPQSRASASESRYDQ